MVNDKDLIVPYTSRADLFRWHGLIVPLLYFGARFLNYLSPIRFCFYAARCPGIRAHAFDEELKKAKPWWQDVSVLLIAVGIATLVCFTHTQPTVSFGVALIAWWLLADIVLYHTNALWFDELQQNKTWRFLRVYSHRRVLFQALINYVESIFLFSLLYRYHLRLTDPVSDVYQASFDLSTSLSRPALLLRDSCIPNIQVGLSIFFLVVVISIVASVGYTRGELAPHDEP